MRNRIAHALLLLAGMIAGLTTAHAQELDVAAEVLTLAVDAQPRQTVSLQVRFTNAGEVWRTVASSLTVPFGWVVLVPPGEITLAPGESRITLIVVLVAPDAVARDYTFPLNYRTSAAAPRGEALFTIRVPALDRVALTLVDAPAFIPAGASHRVEFLLRNTGNTAHEWDLTASSGSGLPVDLSPGMAILGPGDSTTVVALVGASGRLAQQQTHALTLTATSRAAPNVRATARAAVLIVPTTLPAASALHTFPLTMRATYRVGPLVGVDPQPRLVIEVGGRGTIGDRDPGTLDVRLRMTPTSVLERVTLEYQRPTWGVRIGHQDFAPSPLSSSAGGFGVSATATWPLGTSAQLRTVLATYLADGEARLAVAATVGLQHGTLLGVTLGVEGSELLGTLGVRYAPGRRDATALQVTALEATYGLRAAGDVGSAQALRVAGQVNDGASFARLTYDTAAAAFDGRDRHHASLRVAATLRLNDALSIPARFPVDLALGYDRTWAWHEGLAYRLLPPAGAEGQEQRFGVGLSAGIGATAVHASYARTRTSLAHHDTQLEFRALVRSRVTDDLTVAHSAVWTRRQLLGTVTTDALELEAAASLRSDPGLLSTSLTVRYDLDARLIKGVGIGVTWAMEPTPDLRLSLDAALHLLDRADLWGAGLDLRYRLGDGRVLTTKVAGRARPDRPFALTFELGLALPLQVAVGRRSDIGRLEGSITRPDGRGLQGAVVTVAGQAVTTTSAGAFMFPALPIGEHRVLVATVGGLGSTEYLVPDLPVGVVIVDDATTELHFVVADGATVAGRLATEDLDTEIRRTAIAPDTAAERLARGIRIELRHGPTTLHTVTDASGAFRFGRVPAGAWTMHVLLPPTATDYRVDPPEIRLELEPGGHEEVPVWLVPIVRHIQFDDGGTLRPEGVR